MIASELSDRQLEMSSVRFEILYSEEFTELTLSSAEVLRGVQPVTMLALASYSDRKLRKETATTLISLIYRSRQSFEQGLSRAAWNRLAKDNEVS